MSKILLKTKGKIFKKSHISLKHSFKIWLHKVNENRNYSIIQSDLKIIKRRKKSINDPTCINTSDCNIMFDL